MELNQLYADGKYEEVIREIDSRFGWTSEELGRTHFTKECAQHLLKFVSKGESDGSTTWAGARANENNF